tara:strand:- start:4261 stop:6915 length:2655 start_codon:yes stop_codon:yes gene_type:complete
MNQNYGYLINKNVIHLPKGDTSKCEIYDPNITDSDIECKIKELLPNLISYLTNDQELKLTNKHSTILSNILDVTKSQAGYISVAVLDNEEKLMGLQVSALEFNENCGKKSNILNNVSKGVIGAYFPMKIKMLHFQSYDSKKILICNDPKYLEDHQCPGIIFNNLMYIPLYFRKKSEQVYFGLLCLANTEYQDGFCPKIVASISSLLGLISIISKSKRIMDEILQDERLYLIENRGSIDEMSGFMVRNSKELSAIFDSNSKRIVSSDLFTKELSLILNGQELDIDNLDNYSQNDNLAIIGDLIKKCLKKNAKTIKIMHTFTTPTSTLYYDCTYGPIYSTEKDSPIGAYFLGKNITPSKTLENKLKTAKKSLEKALQEKDIYMSRISHELRTPLNSIYGFSQLIEYSSNSGDKIDVDWIKTIVKSSEHLLKLVDEVLDLSKIGSGKIQLSIEDVYISALIKDVVHMLHPEMEKKNLTCKLDINKNGYYVKADSHRLNQVITNIISNAIKYNKKDGNIDIKYEVDKENKKLVIKFIDTGSGIDSDKIKNVGLPFNRCGMEDSPIEGSGLGLALSIGLINQMDCKFDIVSTKGVGTTVSVTCPLSDTSKEIDVLSEFLAIGDTFVGDDSTIEADNLILYIEDNVSNFKLMENIVRRRLGYNIVVTSQGRRGIDIAKSLKPKLIILDMGLPDINGIEVLYNLKSNPESSSIPVMVYSADANPTTIKQARQGGASLYLTKPCDIKILEVEIKKFIQRKDNDKEDTLLVNEFRDAFDKLEEKDYDNNQVLMDEITKIKNNNNEEQNRKNKLISNLDRISKYEKARMKYDQNYVNNKDFVVYGSQKNKELSSEQHLSDKLKKLNFSNIDKKNKSKKTKIKKKKNRKKDKQNI